MDEITTTTPDIDIEYTNIEVLLAEYKQYMTDPENVEIAANYLINSLIDECVLGVVFEVHHSVKTNNKLAEDAMEGEPEDDSEFGITELPDIDVFFGSTQSSNVKKSTDNQITSKCPNCDRTVAASRFAPHLEKCMGMGRNSSRIASRRIQNANSREGNNYIAAGLSDDEDDHDWAGDKRKKKIQPVRTNGSKKNGKSS